MTLLDDWLDARDGEALARAWEALGASVVEVGAPDWSTCRHGAALFASKLLGSVDDLAWLALPIEHMPKATYQQRRTTEHVYLERTFDLRKESFEYWDLFEAEKQGRGVQAVCVAYMTDDGSREGTGSIGQWVVRIFDRKAGWGAAVFIGKHAIATVGAVDTSALTVFERYGNFTPAYRHDDREALRGLIAQLASEIDAHYDVSPAWPARLVRETTDPDPAERLRTYRYEAGPHAIEVADRNCGLTATVDGLGWGMLFQVTLDEAGDRTAGHVHLRLPVAAGERVLAQLARQLDFRLLQ
jgi:hypothetical protein